MNIDPNTESRLNERLQFIQLRRRGANFTSIIQQKLEEEKKQIEEEKNQLASKIRERQMQASNMLDALFEDLKSHEFLQAAEFQNENLISTVHKLKEVQNSLKEHLSISEQEVIAKKEQRLELQKIVGELQRKLNSSANQSFRYENDLYQIGTAISHTISSSMSK